MFFRRTLTIPNVGDFTRIARASCYFRSAPLDGHMVDVGIDPAVARATRVLAQRIPSVLDSLPSLATDALAREPDVLRDATKLGDRAMETNVLLGQLHITHLIFRTADTLEIRYATHEAFGHHDLVLTMTDDGMIRNWALDG